MFRGKRESRKLAALATVIGSLTLLACPGQVGAKPAKGAGQAAARAGFFGTTVVEVPTSEEYQRMAAGGLRHLRVTFFHEMVEPKPGQRDWRLYDKLVGDAAHGGVTLDPVLFGSPSWMNPAPSILPIQNRTQASYWYGFVRDAALRYGPHGQFWAQHRDIAAHPIRDWEVWNEPNINEFAGGRAVKARDYGKLLRVTGRALHGANRGNRVLLGGLYRRPQPGHGARMTRFLERLYKLRRGRSLFDAVAIHPYAARPLQVLRVTNRARKVMDANGDAGKSIYITELGWTTGGDHWAQSLYRTTQAGQATRLRRTARLLLAHRRRLRLRRVIWHTWRDYAGGTNFWDHYMGLFTVDGFPKPAWLAFTRLTGGVTGGQLRDFGQQELPPGPPPAPGGTGPAPPPPPPPPDPGCFLIIFCS